MHKYLYVALACLLSVISCGDNNEESNLSQFAQWKQSNDEAFDRVANDPSYTELKTESNSGSIYYKVIKEGSGTASPYFNSTVKVYYTGWFVVDGNSYQILPTDSKEEAYVFDAVDYPYQAPAELNLNEMIEGWYMSLPHMKTGDRWEIWIPFLLGYGTSGNVNPSTGAYTILPYSTLKFEVEVVEIVTP